MIVEEQPRADVRRSCHLGGPRCWDVAAVVRSPCAAGDRKFVLA